MEAKEKAYYLIKAMETYQNGIIGETLPLAKKCALIAVNELLKTLPSVNGRPPNYQDVNEYCVEYWEQVANEINTFAL